MKEPEGPRSHTLFGLNGGSSGHSIPRRCGLTRRRVAPPEARERRRSSSWPRGIEKSYADGYGKHAKIRPILAARAVLVLVCQTENNPVESEIPIGSRRRPGRRHATATNLAGTSVRTYEIRIVIRTDQAYPHSQYIPSRRQSGGTVMSSQS